MPYSLSGAYQRISLLSKSRTKVPDLAPNPTRSENRYSEQQKGKCVERSKLTVQSFTWGGLFNPPFNRDPKDREGTLKKYGEFDPSLVSYPEVWIDPDATDKPWILDGGGRHHMAVRDGYADASVDCVVFHGTREEARERWYKLNTQRKALSTIDVFMSNLKSGDADETAINSVVTSAGFKISSNNGPGIIQATVFLRTAYDDGCLEDILQVVKDAFGALGDGNNKQMLEALLHLFTINYNRRPRVDRLAKVLGNVGSARIYCSRVTKGKKYDEYRSGRDKIAADIAVLYNAGAQSDGIKSLRKPEVPTRRKD